MYEHCVGYNVSVLSIMYVLKGHGQGGCLLLATPSNAMIEQCSLHSFALSIGGPGY